MDSEPMLPEEYEDPDDEDVFLNDVLDQKVLLPCCVCCTMTRGEGGEFEGKIQKIQIQKTSTKKQQGCIVFVCCGGNCVGGGIPAQGALDARVFLWGGGFRISLQERSSTAPM